MLRLIATAAFERNRERFLRRHPQLRIRLDATLRNLAADPQNPRLALHALRGDLDDLYALRLTYRYRIVVLLSLKDEEIHLLDIGSHDEVYR